MKLCIVGCGFVGSTFAYRAMLLGYFSRIVLVDVNTQKAEAEALDIGQASVIEGACFIKAGDWQEATNSDFIVINAGINTNANKVFSRLELAKVNTGIITSIALEVKKYCPNAIVLISSNPVDVMTAVFAHISGFEKQRVIGSGTWLDSARLRYYLARRLGLGDGAVNGFVIGEHGDSMLPLFSNTHIFGEKIISYCQKEGLQWNKEIESQIAEQVVAAAKSIIAGKGATYYGIASAMMDILSAIIEDRQCILPLSCFPMGKYGITDKSLAISLPCVVGSGGVQRVVELGLDQLEEQALDKSVQLLSQNLYQFLI